MKNCWKRILSLVLCMAMVLPMIPTEVVWAASGDEVQTISTAEDFFAIMDDPDGRYRLETNLNLGRISPLGYESGEAFSGELDGNGHTISYTMVERQGVDSYGLFQRIDNANIVNLNLSVDVDLELKELKEYTVGLLAAHSNASSMGGINVDGDVRIVGEMDENCFVYFGGLIGNNPSKNNYGDESNPKPIASYCELDIQALIQCGTIVYSGFLHEGEIHSSILSGDIELNGKVKECILLNNASQCISAQNLYAQITHTSDFCIDSYGENNHSNGTIELYWDPDYTWDGYEMGSGLLVLDHCSESTFSGSVYTGEFPQLHYPYVAGAYNCEYVNINGTFSIYNPTGKVQFGGLVCCENSTLNANIEVDFSGDSSLCLSREGKYNQVSCDLSAISTVPTGDLVSPGTTFYGLYDETSSHLKGSYDFFISGIESIYEYGITATILFGASNCVAEGTFSCESERGSTLFGAAGGTGNALYADFFGYGNKSDIIILDYDTNSYFEGNVYSTGSVTACEGINCIVKANIESDYCVLFDTADASAFYGNVNANGFDAFDYSDNCYANGTFRITSDCLRAVGDSCRIDGDLSLNFDDSRYYARVYCNTPVTVNYSDGFVWNTANGYLCKHTESTCTEKCPQYTSVPSNDHYSLLLEVEYGTLCSLEEVTANWPDTMNVETGTIRTDAEPQSYTIRILNPDETPLANAQLTLGSDIYYADANGCLTLNPGPGVISPLVISAPREDGGYQDLLTYATYYPIPNQVNTIYVEYRPDFELRLTEKDADTSSQEEIGFPTINVFGEKINLLEVPIAVDLDIDTKGLKINHRVNTETGRNEVTIGSGVTGKNDTALDGKESILKTIENAKKGKFGNNVSDEFKLMDMQFLGVKWKTRILGYLEYDFDIPTGQFTLYESSILLRLEGEARVVQPLLPPLSGFYITGAFSGRIDAKLGAKLTEDEVAMMMVGIVFGEVKPQIQTEVAFGGGLRAVDIYSEVGVAGRINAALELPYRSAQESLKASASLLGFAEFRLLAFGVYYHEIKLIEKPIWPQTAQTRSLTPSVNEFELLSRDYLKGRTASNARTGKADSAISTVDDASSDYPYSVVDLHQLSDGRFLMLYSDDDASRADGDRFVLRAVIGTVSDGEIQWGQPMTIDNDGTADFSYHVSVSGNEAAVIWQDADQSFGNAEGMTIEEMASHIDLSYAILNCSEDVPVATQTGQVTKGNGQYESRPTVYYDGEGFRFAWVTAESNDPSQWTQEESYTLWISYGAGLTPKIAAENQNPIGEIVLTGGNLIWSSLADAEEESYDLWRYSGYSAKQEKTGNINNLQFNGKEICYTEGNQLYRGEYLSDCTLIGESDLYSNPIRLADDGELYYLENGLDHARGYLIQDGELIPVQDFDGFVSNWSMTGEQAVALVKTNVGTESVEAHLISQQNQEITDFRMGDIGCSNYDAVPGSKVTIETEVFNYGNTEIDELNVLVTTQSGEVLYEASESAEMGYGESQLVTADFVVPENFTPQDVTVSINGIEEKLALGVVNLGISGRWDEYRPDVVVVDVDNTGIGTASGTVTVRNGDTVLHRESVSVPQGKRISIPVAFDSIQTGSCELTVTLEESSDSAYEFDNQAQIRVHPVYAKSVFLSAVYLEPGQKQNVNVQIMPAGSIMPDLQFRVEDTAIATVSEDGCVSAVSAGETILTATTEDGSSYQTAIIVTDSAKPSVPEDPKPTTPTEPEETEPTMPSVPDESCEHPAIGLSNSKDATCTETGYSGDIVCFFCGMILQEGHIIDKKAHTEVIDEAEEATCIASGKTEGKHCSDCQTVLVKQEIIPAAGHTWSEWTVSKPATGAEMGEEIRFCTVCGAEETRSIDKLSNPFVDVQAGKFYETPVLWAVENEVTNGMDATHFAPNDKCTRAQVVTFLWRAAGSPEPTSNENPFVDVVEGKFYYKAVLWAVEEGITNGVDATHFGTNNECTRGHVATFLWRTLGNPVASGTNPFEDVPAGKFYYDAVLWAAESGVTTGVSAGKFDPSGTCTRGQIVTFLYRALG